MNQFEYSNDSPNSSSADSGPEDYDKYYSAVLSAKERFREEMESRLSVTGTQTKRNLNDEIRLKRELNKLRHEN
jgi:hypothetical protein